MRGLPPKPFNFGSASAKLGERWGEDYANRHLLTYLSFAIGVDFVE